MEQTTIVRVMVIDDDPVSNKITKLLLRKHNWPAAADAFEDGLVDALGVLKEGMEGSNPAPEVILPDMDMPVFSGWDFMNEYSTLPDSLTGQSLLYMVSSGINPPDMKRAGNYPLIKACITKPLTPEALEQILADHYASTQV